MMVEKITKDIKITVISNYDGTHYPNDSEMHLFSYFITIENCGNDTVQLLTRKWEIHDSLNHTEIVKGDGVVGQIPIIEPNEKYTYRSNCLLSSKIGSMKGYFEMINFSSKKKFKVQIPTFQLIVKHIFN